MAPVPAPLPVPAPSVPTASDVERNKALDDDDLCPPGEDEDSEEIKKKKKARAAAAAVPGTQSAVLPPMVDLSVPPPNYNMHPAAYGYPHLKAPTFSNDKARNVPRFGSKSI